MNFNKLDKLKQWSKSHKLATAGALAGFLLIAGAGVVVGVAALAHDHDDLGSCPDYGPSPDAIMLSGEQALSCVVQGHCSLVEVYDPVLAAAERRGSNAGFEGFDFGCVPVCVWHNDGDLLVEPEEVKFYRFIPDGMALDSSGVIAPHRNYLFRNIREVFGPGSAPEHQSCLCAWRHRSPARPPPGQLPCL